MKKLFVFAIALMISSSVFAKMDSNLAPLVKAVKKGQNSELTRLLKQDMYKSNVNATIGKKKVPLLFIAIKKGNKSVVENLLKNGADPLAKDAAKVTALMIAADKGYLSIAKLILEYIPNQEVRTNYVNSQDEDGSTALLLAIESGADNMSVIVRTLLENKADPQLANYDGDTPVQLAKDYEMTGIVSLMTMN